MGWGSASTVMDAVIASVRANVPDEATRTKIYGPIYDALRDDDWDTVDECLDIDPAFDALVREREPDWFLDEDDDYCGVGEAEP